MLGGKHSLVEAAVTAVATRTRLRSQRALHLVDLENLMGGPTSDMDRIHTAWDLYARVVQPQDQVMVGLSAFSARHAAFCLPTNVLLKVRHGGKDAAEEALVVDSLDLRHASGRFHWLVVASADLYFVPVMQQARELGMRVWSVIAGEDTRSIGQYADLRSRIFSRGFPWVSAVQSGESDKQIGGRLGVRAGTIF